MPRPVRTGSRCLGSRSHSLGRSVSFLEFRLIHGRRAVPRGHAEIKSGWPIARSGVFADFLPVCHGSGVAANCAKMLGCAFPRGSLILKIAREARSVIQISQNSSHTNRRTNEIPLPRSRSGPTAEGDRRITGYKTGETSGRPSPSSLMLRAQESCRGPDRRGGACRWLQDPLEQPRRGETPGHDLLARPPVGPTSGLFVYL